MTIFFYLILFSLCGFTNPICFCSNSVSIMCDQEGDRLTDVQSLTCTLDAQKISIIFPDQFVTSSESQFREILPSLSSIFLGKFTPNCQNWCGFGYPIICDGDGCGKFACVCGTAGQSRHDQTVRTSIDSCSLPIGITFIIMLVLALTIVGFLYIFCFKKRARYLKNSEQVLGIRRRDLADRNQALINRSNDLDKKQRDLQSLGELLASRAAVLESYRAHLVDCRRRIREGELIDDENSFVYDNFEQIRPVFNATFNVESELRNVKP